MTDKEIIKALECCRDKIFKGCDNCAMDEDNDCIEIVCANVLNLIHRQQAEIERLERANKILSKNADDAFQEGLNEAQDLYAEQVKNEVKAEAIKEFADRLKDEINQAIYIYYNDAAGGYYLAENCIDEIDNLVKEMVGEQK